MKKLILFSIVLFVIFFTGCQDSPFHESGSMQVFLTTENTSVKSVLPVVSMDISYYVITISGGITSVNPYTLPVADGNLVLFESLSPSTYNVLAEAFNVDDIKIARDESPVEVLPGDVSSVVLTVVPLTGNGTVTWEAYWESGLIAQPAWDFQLKKIDALDYTPLNMALSTDTSGYTHLSYTGTYDAGYYVAYGQLKDDEHLVWGSAGIYRILAGEITSVAPFEITQETMNQAGKIDVTLMADLKDPIRITFDDPSNYYVSGSTVTIKAEPDEAVDVYLWFLNGVPQAESSDTFTFTPRDGHYIVDCAVIRGNDRAGSVEHAFSVGPVLIPTDNLVLYLPFNGNADDESGNGNNGTLHNATLVPDRYGNPDSAYYFNGAALDNYIYFSSSPVDNEPFTVSFWAYREGGGMFYSDDATNGASNFHSSRGNGGVYYYRLGSGTGSHETTLAGSTAMDDLLNRWTHMAFRYDGSMMTAFIDGILDAQKNWTGGYDTSNGKPFIIGQKNYSPGSSGNEQYTGMIDDYRIYNAALSDDEIYALSLE